MLSVRGAILLLNSVSTFVPICSKKRRASRKPKILRYSNTYLPKEKWLLPTAQHFESTSLLGQVTSTGQTTALIVNGGNQFKSYETINMMIVSDVEGCIGTETAQLCDLVSMIRRSTFSRSRTFVYNWLHLWFFGGEAPSRFLRFTIRRKLLNPYRQESHSFAAGCSSASKSYLFISPVKTNSISIRHVIVRGVDC